MSRWDKFLNSASRGYGVGFNRYGDYAEARDERENRADAAGMYEAQKAATADLAMQGEAYSRPGALPVNGPERLPTTAVPTGAEPQMATPAVPTGQPSAPLPPGQPPAGGAGGQDVPYAQMAASVPDYADDLASKSYLRQPAEQPPAGALPANPVSTAPAGGEPGGIQTGPDAVPNMIRAAKAQGATDEQIIATTNGRVNAADIKKAMVGSEKAVAKTAPEKAVDTKEAATETLAAVLPRQKASGVPVTGVKYSRADTRTQHWDKMRDHAAAIAARTGDYETLLNLDSKIQGMQQAKLQENLTTAIRLSSMGDTEGAAEALYNAYSYYPDGTEMDLRVEGGKLIGYAYNEETGDFRGAQELTPEKMAQLLQHTSDPVAFQQSMKESRLATEAAAEEKRRWKIENGQETEKIDISRKEMEIERIAKAAGAIKDKAQAGYYMAQATSERYGTTGAGGWGDPADGKRGKYMESQLNHFKDGFAGKYPSGSVDAFLYDPDGWLGAGRMMEMSDSIAGNTTGQAQIGAAEHKGIVETLAAWEVKNSGYKGLDSEVDKLMTEKLDPLGRVEIHGLNPLDPTQVVATVNGQQVLFNGTKWPALLNKARNPQGAAAQEQAAAVDAAPAAAAPPKDARATAGSELAALSGVYDSVVNARTPRANMPGAGRIAMEQ